MGASSLVDHMTKLSIYSTPATFRRTSIICTIGPKTKNVESLGALFDAGMNVVRMNFSHGTYEYHGEVIANTRKMVEGKIEDGVVPCVAIALDTKGPEIRTGMTSSGGDVQLTKGNKIVVTTDPAHLNACDEKQVYMDYTNLPKMVEVGSEIYIDDGLICLKVLEKADTSVTCEIQNSGMLGGKKGVNLPNIDVDLPALSEKDKADIKFAVSQNVDMVFASFIRKASDIAEVRACLGEEGAHINVIAKIENHEGVRNFDEILAVTDGVMVARGDLGIEVPAEKVFLAQKMMIAKCNLAGKPVICATQMLETMTTNPRPTRAEASDVANAVLDGADCVMLSGETAKGAYPVETVDMMGRICLEAESASYLTALTTAVGLHNMGEKDITATVASAAVQAANGMNAGSIVCLTHSGLTAQKLAQHRPTCPILVVTREPRTARIVHLYRGCYPLLYPHDKLESDSWEEDVEKRFQFGMQYLMKKGHMGETSPVIGVQGVAPGQGSTGMMKVVRM
jgi:pyruvate kinase